MDPKTLKEPLASQERPDRLGALPWGQRLEGETPAFYASLLRTRNNPKGVAELLACAVGIEMSEFDYQVPTDCRMRVHIFSDDDIADPALSPVVFTCFREIFAEAIERSDALVQSIVDMLYVYGVTQSSKALVTMRVGYLFLDLYGKLEEWFKFQTTYISAALLKQDVLPDTPSFLEGTRLGVIGGGKLFRWIRNLANKSTVTREVMSCAASILALKRGALPLRPELVEESLTKHRTTLSQEPMYNGYLNPIVEALYEINEVLRPEFRSQKMEWRIPSASSAFGWRRAEGGAFSAIVDTVKRKLGVFAGSSTELAGYTDGFNPMPIYVPCFMFDAYQLVLEEAKKESLDCDVHVVLEPMKARIITSGPPNRYHICRILQKCIHTAMRGRKEFSLIGGPATSELIESNFRMLSSLQSSHWVIVSADYSAATDNINGLLCEAYVDIVARELGLDDETRKIYRESMTNHILHYPEEFGGFVELQRNGQLMGSPSSFPGLCQINIATLYAAWRSYVWKRSVSSQLNVPLYKRPMPSYGEFLSDLRPMANCDDLLFIAPPDFVPFWRNWVNAAGLKPSPGKNYVSRDFAVINSTFFQVTRGDDVDWVNRRGQVQFGHSLHFNRVHWVGSGLLKGQARVLSDTRSNDAVADNVDFGQLNSQLRWVLDWEPGRELERERCMAIWFRNMRHVLMSQERSWRLPVLLGGLGLPIGSATRPQLVFANMIVKKQLWGLANSMQVRPKIENPVTKKQLEFELHLRNLHGLKRCPEALLPWTLHMVPAEASPSGERQVKIVEARVVDTKIPDWMFGLPQWNTDEDTPLQSADFVCRMNYLIKQFNGGPMALEDVDTWDQPLLWYGTGWKLPSPQLLDMRVRCNKIARALSDEVESLGWSFGD